MTTDVADSASGDMLFRPEYAAENDGCACVATVAWKWRLARSGACGSSAPARSAASAQRPSARTLELHIAITSGLFEALPAMENDQVRARQRGWRRSPSRALAPRDVEEALPLPSATLEEALIRQPLVYPFATLVVSGQSPVFARTPRLTRAPAVPLRRIILGPAAVKAFRPGPYPGRV